MISFVAGRVFPARLAALLDLYTVLGDTSCSLQNLQQLPWERQETFRKMVEKFRLKGRTLPSSRHRNGSTVLREDEFEAALLEGDEDDIAALSEAQVCI